MPAGELFPARAPSPDVLRIEIEKLDEPLDPLFHELTAMHQHQRVHPALRDQPGRQHGLAESGGGRQHSEIVGQHGLARPRLFLAQPAGENRLQLRAGTAFVPDLRANLESTQQFDRLLEAAARQADVLPDDPRRRQRCAACHGWTDASPAPGKTPGSGTPPAAPGRLRREGGRRFSARKADPQAPAPATSASGRREACALFARATSARVPRNSPTPHPAPPAAPPAPGRGLPPSQPGLPAAIFPGVPGHPEMTTDPGRETGSRPRTHCCPARGRLSARAGR